MVINPYVLYMQKNLIIHTFSTPNMSLISQAMPEKSGVSKLSWTAGHPVAYINFPVNDRKLMSVIHKYNTLSKNK